MKTNFLKIAAVVLCGLSVGFAACGDDTMGGGDANNPANGGMSRDEQKSYLEDVALEFANQIPAGDFADLQAFGREFGELYEDSDWSEVSGWAHAAIDNAMKQIGNADTQDDKPEELWDGYFYYHTYVYTNYEALFAAANFTAHFTYTNGVWVKSEADDLEFIFADKAGNPCSFRIAASGSEKTVHVVKYEDYHYDYESGDNWSKETEYHDTVDLWLTIPEKVVMTLVRNGSTLVTWSVDVDLSGITGEEFDLSRNSLGMSVSAEFNNGYSVHVTNANYKANASAAASAVFSKNGKNLLTLAASAYVEGLPSVNTSAFEDGDFDKVNAKNLYVKFDILGRVQIQGKIKNFRSFYNAVNDAESSDSEIEYKSYINAANAQLDLGLYYDNSSEKQAEVKLEAFMDEDWDGYRYWTFEPVIKFFDGSSYSSFSAFFNERDFKSVVDAIEKLLEEYDEMFDFGLFDDDEYEEPQPGYWGY